MRNIILVLSVISFLYNMGQIPIYQSGEQSSKQSIVYYDSLKNISAIYREHPYGNKRYDYYRGLIGQSIIFNPAFSIHNNSYMPQLCWKGLEKNKISELIGKKFLISDVVSDGILDNPVFVLYNNEIGEKIRYSPDACGMEPFLCQGYFEWMVNTYKGNDWLYKNLYPSENIPCLVDSETGELISSDSYMRLKCTDVQLKLPQNRGYRLNDRGGVVLLFVDSIGNQYHINMGFDNAGEGTYNGWRGKPQIGIAHILLSLEQRENEINEQKQVTQKVDAEEAERMVKCIKLFGADKGKMIYLGIVELGMTKEMCSEALGKPDNINSSQTKNEIFEQWVYPDRYIYFQNGEIVSIDKFE